MGSILNDFVSVMTKEMEKKEEAEATLGHYEKKKVTVSTRFDEYELYNLDKLALKLGLTRSSLLYKVARAAIFDVIEDMNLSEQFASDYVNWKKEGSKNV